MGKYYFRGKHVLVTGGSRGIGKAIVDAFARHGARVAINYNRNRKAADETMRSLPGGPHVIAQADVTVPSSAESLIETVITKLGGLEIVVNNAGINIAHPLDKVDFIEWQKAWRDTLDVNLIGPANVTYHAAKHMMRTGGGRIVNVSSRGAFRGEDGTRNHGDRRERRESLSLGLHSLTQGVREER